MILNSHGTEYLVWGLVKNELENYIPKLRLIPISYYCY